MKTDTLTGPNLSYWVATLEKADVRMHCGHVYYNCADEDEDNRFDYADPATFQPIAEREKISVRFDDVRQGWYAVTMNKRSVADERYRATVHAYGWTEAEARMRCYVKSYLGDDTKGE